MWPDMPDQRLDYIKRRQTELIGSPAVAFASAAS
jgi:hypothetical protein